MARLKIKDAPLLTTIVGDEKIPTGGKGDFSVTVDMLLSNFEGRLPFATKTELENVRQALDAKISNTKTTLELSISALDSRVTTSESNILGVQQDLTTHKADKANPHSVTKQQVGLGNVDNTSDINKPVSTATQAAIDAVKNKKKKAVDVLDESGLTQQEWNNGVESVADLALIQNPKDGNRVFVKSYHKGLNKGGGTFIYDATKANKNDGGVILNGWVRQLKDNVLNPYVFGAYGDLLFSNNQVLAYQSGHDDTLAFQKC